MAQGQENIIVGRLIPAGTGRMMNKIRQVAQKRDDLILDAREAEEPMAEVEAVLEDLSESAPAE